MDIYRHWAPPSWGEASSQVRQNLRMVDEGDQAVRVDVPIDVPDVETPAGLPPMPADTMKWATVAVAVLAGLWLVGRK